jgi:aryl-alcohol dehydrogenase-like predicted oxidoreductase
VITYFSLASGFLTGKYRSVNDLAKSSRSGFVKKYLDDRGFRILRALDQVSRQHNSTPAAVSLAWLLSRPGITATIASATNLEQLDALISATRLVLDPVSIELLKQASSY